MSETGASRRSAAKEPKIEPSLSPGEISNSPNILGKSFAQPRVHRQSPSAHMHIDMQKSYTDMDPPID